MPWILGGLLLISLFINIAFGVIHWQRSVVTSVPDGDSLQLADGRRVRLKSIDAPERGRCMADEARTKLQSIVLNKHIRLKHIVTDDYGRTLAIVILEDPSRWLSYLRSKLDLRANSVWEADPLLNRIMLREGLARFSSTDLMYRDTLKHAADEAKAAKRGIYSDDCRATDPKTDCQIKGNLRAGFKTYYLSTCSSYDQVVVDEAYGDKWFCTESEAAKAGFTKAKGC